MRIIGGKYKGLRFSPPKDLPVRPTTDMAKEALFNILQHRLDFDAGIYALDLFSGTGGIALELASRGADSVVAVDRHAKCLRFLSDTARKVEIETIVTVRSDVFTYLERYDREPFDFIFADPPYALDRLPMLPGLIRERNLLKAGGLFVLEFPSTVRLPTTPQIAELRKYGNSSFAIYDFRS